MLLLIWKLAAVAFLVTSLFKSSSLSLTITSNPTGCSRPTSNGTCAVEALACKPTAGCPAPSGAWRMSARSLPALAGCHRDVLAGHEETHSALACAEWRGKPPRSSAPLDSPASSDRTGRGSTISTGILPHTSGGLVWPWRGQAVPELIRALLPTLVQSAGPQ